MRNPIAIVAGLALCASLLGGCGGGSGANEGILSFVSLDFSVNENGTPNSEITIQRLGGTGAVSVTVVLTDGTATAPADYDATPIVVSWAAGDQTPKIITVPIVDDHEDEPPETIHLALVNPTGGATIRHPLGDATLTIVDNDVAGSIGFGIPFYVYGENGAPLGLEVTVVRTGGMDGQISATLTSADDTANSDPASLVEPVDYVPVNMTVTFADQDTTPIVISLAGTIIQDVLPELDETFMLQLTDPTGGASVGPTSSATVLIVDDDPFLEIQNPGFGGHFGTSVVKLGARLVIGAPANSSQAGTVYTIDPATGSPIDTITRPFSNQLGISLAADGNTLAIGSLGNVWVLDAATLADRFVLTSAISGFGNALLGLGDGRLAVGAPHAQADAGAALIYDALTGAPLQSIDGAPGNMLGTSFALLGTDLLIGAPGITGAVLQYAGTPLAQTFAFVNPSPETPPAAFGRSLATAEGSVFIGAPDSDAGGAVDGGAVHLFTAGGVMSVAPGVPGAHFGANLLLIGDKLCIQAPGEGPSGSGRVHVYDRSLFFNYAPIDDPTPTPMANFGGALCEFDGVLVVGAPSQDTFLPGQGKVFIFKLN